MLLLLTLLLLLLLLQQQQQQQQLQLQLQGNTRKRTKTAVIRPTRKLLSALGGAVRLLPVDLHAAVVLVPVLKRLGARFVLLSLALSWLTTRVCAFPR